jgi:Asp-tRNA(Asn)/Glu-tRNA(Gln) amidotransferase A subunit family amidase
MNGDPLFDATATAEQIRSGTVTRRVVTSAALGRIAARDPDVRAFVRLAPDALAQATVLDREPRAGLLDGIPVAVKDIIATAGLETNYGSPIYAGHVPEQDADCVRKLKSAGAVIIGKTVTTEFAHLTAGPTRNPHDLTRTPGGSSSGSAAAVAAGMVPLALGSSGRPRIAASTVSNPASEEPLLGACTSWRDRSTPSAGSRIRRRAWVCSEECS